MSWVSELSAKSADASLGPDALAACKGFETFERVGTWPDTAQHLNNDVLDALSKAFTGVSEHLLGLVSKFIESQYAKEPDVEIDEPTLSAWMTQALTASDAPKEMVELLADIDFPSKFDTVSDTFEELQRLAERAAKASQNLMQSGSFDTEHENGTREDADAENSGGASDSDGASTNPTSIAEITVAEILDTLAPNEANDALVATLASIVRKIQDDGKKTTTLAELTRKIDEVKLSEVGGNAITSFRIFAKSDNRIRAALKELANKIFGREPSALKSFANDEEEDTGKEDGNDKRSIGRYQKYVVGGIVFAALALLISVFFTEIQEVPGLLHNFSINEVARGFITLTFVVGAISIFLIVTTVVVFEEKSYPKDVYERAKTILSMILGILGTVIGFYFGTSDSDEAIAADPAFSVAIMPLEFARVGESYTLDIAALAAGGDGPIRFTVSLLDPDGSPIAGIGPFTYTRSTGVLSETIYSLPLQSGVELMVEIVALDADRVPVVQTGDLQTVP